ncbi:MAG: SOS response-associated peptidase family protein [Eggerthellaceae bacterium]|jgi:putative SOS response-associated peptidase YedK
MCGRFVMVSFDEVRGIVHRIEQRQSLLQLPDWPLIGPQADGGRAAQLLARPNAYPGSRIAVFGSAQALGVEPEGAMAVHTLRSGAWPAGTMAGARGEEASASALDEQGEEVQAGATLRASESGPSAESLGNDATTRVPEYASASCAEAQGASECVQALGIDYLTWGYAVDWQRNPVFNTRIESALSGRGMWCASIEQRRCVVPTAGFFEPHAQEKIASRRTGRPVKRPYLFGRANGTPTLLAGVFDKGQCSIVTTQPNASVAPVHNRMPLVLEPAEALTWIGGSLDDIAQLADRSRELLAVAPEDALTPPPDSHDDGASSGQLSLF